MAEENTSPSITEETDPQANIQQPPAETASPQPVQSVPKAIGSKKSLVKKLLAVVVLILIIVALIFAGMHFYKSWQIKQRDSQRITNLDAIKKALQQQKGDSKDAKYYVTDTIALSPKYIKTVPTDPTSQNCGQGVGKYCYYPGPKIPCLGICTDYRLISRLENANDPQIAASQTKCPNPGAAWTVATPAYNPKTDFVVCPS